MTDLTDRPAVLTDAARIEHVETGRRLLDAAQERLQALEEDILVTEYGMRRVEILVAAAEAHFFAASLDNVSQLSAARGRVKSELAMQSRQQSGERS